MQKSSINWSGIAWFLGITFAITWLVEGLMIAGGLRFEGAPPVYAQLIVSGLMWAPALGAFIVRKWITREGFADAGLRFGSWRPYLAMLLGVPALFALVYLLTGLLGLGSPDWQMSSLVQLMADAGSDTAAIPANLTLVIFLVTVFAAPWINSLFGFGEEFGWTGYLMPRLLPLGKWRAALIYGVIWGLWHAPLVLVGFNYPGYPIPGLLMMSLLATVLGFFQMALWLRDASVLQTAFFHGVINSQGYGIWRMVYADAHPLLGGMAGLVGLLVFGLVGGYLLARAPLSAPGGSLRRAG